jgi:hypothetical protein
MFLKYFSIILSKNPPNKQTKPNQTTKKSLTAGCWWLMSIILATQEAELRSAVQSQPGQTVFEMLS